MAKNKPTSSMSCRKIARMINNVLRLKNERDNKGNILSISYKTVNNILKDYYGKPKKIRKVFYLSEKNKEQRFQFCKMILERKINFDEIMFTDESKISMGSYTHDFIRLDPKDQEKLKTGERDVYSLINRAEHKFECSIIIAGGICFYGTTKLIIVNGTMNNFAYGQTLLFYEEDMKKISQKYGKKLILEQDGPTAHTCKINKHLLEKLFTKDGWIQNPPNSSDLAYPIEDLWGIIKPRIKRRNPASIIEMTKILIEEWNSIPQNLVKNLCKGYLERVKKVYELKGQRLEPEDIRKYKKNEEVYSWNTPDELPKLRIVYNNEIINFLRKKEIKELEDTAKEIAKSSKREIKTSNDIKKKYKKRDLKNMSIGRVFSIINGPEKAIQKREESIANIEKEINIISKMSLWEYLGHIKEKDENKEDNKNEKEEEDGANNSVSTIDEMEEQKLSSLEKLIKEDKNLNYKQGLIRRGKNKTKIKEIKKKRSKKNNINNPGDIISNGLIESENDKKGKDN